MMMMIMTFFKKLFSDEETPIGHGDVQIGEYQNSNFCSPSMPDFSPVHAVIICLPRPFRY